jgi:hypothetical protein
MPTSSLLQDTASRFNVYQNAFASPQTPLYSAFSHRDTPVTSIRIKRLASTALHKNTHKFFFKINNYRIYVVCVTKMFKRQVITDVIRNKDTARP